MGARSTTCHCRRQTAFLFWKYGQIKKKAQGTLGSKCPSWWSKGRPRRLIHKDVMEKHKRTFWPTQYLAHHEWLVLQESSLSHLKKGLFGGKDSLIKCEEWAQCARGQFNESYLVPTGKEPTCQCRTCKRCGFDPWVGKIPWRRAWQPTPVFLPGEHSSLRTEEPGELHGARGVHGVAKSQTWLKWFSMEHRWPDTLLGRKWVLRECDWLRNEEIWLHLLALILPMEDVWLCDPMDCSSPGSSVHGISQTRMLEWVAISFSRGSSQPREQTRISWVSCTGRWILYQLSHWLEG